MAVNPQQTSPERRSMRPTLRWSHWLLLLGTLIYGLAFIMHWDDRGALWVLERFESTSEQNESVWLPDYVAVIDAKPLPGMEKDEAAERA